MNPLRENFGRKAFKALVPVLVLANIFSTFAPSIVFASISSNPQVGETETWNSPGSGNWTVPGGVTSVKIKVWGAGGAAGNGEKITDSHRSGLGGGGGAYSEKTVSVSGGDSFSINVGAGGQGIRGVDQGRQGNFGGDSSVSGSFGNIMAGGGQGGTSYTGHGNPTGDLGFGGQASGGDVNMSGSNAEPYIEFMGDPYASNGGGSPYGGNGGSRGRCGRDGTCPGSEPGSPLATDGGFPGGGGGGSDVASGGYGANGQVQIEVVSVVPPPPVNQSPLGYLDNATCTSFIGWSYDPSDENAQIGVHFYADGPAGTGVFVGDTIANLPRADVNAGGVSGDHGFNYPLPESLKDSATHQIYAYGIDTAGGTNTLLGNTMTISGCTGGGGGGGTLTNDIAFITVPTSVVAGQPIVVEVKNTGTKTWGTNHDLAISLVDQNAISLASLATTPSGSNKTVTLTAPATPGTYILQAVEQGVSWFGGTSHTITVTASGGGGGGGGTVTNPTVTLTANPSALTAAGAVTLTWTSTDSNACGTSWSGSGKPLNGTETSPVISTTTVFTVTCTSPSGGTGSASATVTVNIGGGGGGGGITNPTVTLTASPNTLTATGTVALTWTSTNSNSCTTSWSGGGKAVNGTEISPVISSSTLFSITCTNASGGSGGASAIVIVNIGGGGGGVTNPVVTLIANPTILLVPGTVNLTWTSTNSNACATSWSGGLKGPNGSETSPTISATTTFSVTCTNTTGGSAVSSATVGFGTVVGGTIRDITLTSPSSLSTTEAGGTVTFTAVLTSAPTANVTVPVMSSNVAEGSTGPGTLTFTPTNWNSPQVITVTGVDDSSDDGDISYVVTVGPASSADSNWNNIPAKTVSLSNIDNDSTTIGGGGGGGGGSTGGSGGSGSRRRCTGFGCPVAVATSTISDILILIDGMKTGTKYFGPEQVCPKANFITTFLRYGVDNNPNEVRKLQYFLNTYENAGLTVSGDFDQATEQAVKDLQVSHTDEILAPWGVTAPTGIVYLTTTKYINTVYCNDHPGYIGNEDIKDILDSTITAPTPINPDDFDDAIGQATTSPNIAAVAGSGRLKDINPYGILVLLILLIGTGFTIYGISKKDITSDDKIMAVMRGIAILAIGSVLNVLNTLSFILNPEWFTHKTNLSLTWLLGLVLVNLIVVIIISMWMLVDLYTKSIEKA